MEREPLTLDRVRAVSVQDYDARTSKLKMLIDQNYDYLLEGDKQLLKHLKDTGFEKNYLPVAESYQMYFLPFLGRAHTPENFKEFTLSTWDELNVIAHTQYSLHKAL